MKEHVLACVAERMNRLPEVAWDRCILHGDDGVVYGWIGRDDGRSDFVVLEVSHGTTTGLDGAEVEWLAVGFSTSSAKHSKAISERLNGKESVHRDCERVEQVFGALVGNAVRLGA